MSILNELQRSDQMKRLASLVNKRNKQVKQLLSEREALLQQVASLKEELESKSTKRTTTRKSKTKSSAVEESENADTK